MLIKKHGIANIVWHGMASYWCHQWWCYTDVILVHCMMSRHVWCHIDALHGRLGGPKQIWCYADLLRGKSLVKDLLQ